MLPIARSFRIVASSHMASYLSIAHPHPIALSLPRSHDYDSTFGRIQASAIAATREQYLQRWVISGFYMVCAEDAVINYRGTGEL